MTQKQEDRDIITLLSKGADERIFTNENGLTRYGVSASNIAVINRGSCTCSVVTDDSIELIKDMYQSVKDPSKWIAENDQIFDRVKVFINDKNEDDFELFLAPSGTDLVYVPLILSKLIAPKRNILNITTCIEELGSGTRLASSGKYYSNYNQFGETVAKGDSILANNDIETYFCKARCEKGEIINNQEEIIDVVKKHPEHSIIINLVYGSKSGIEDNLELIDKIDAPNVLWNTDLCQFRHSKEIIKKLIRKNSTVMITGSKFYQCPPFCAAVLIPKTILNNISKKANANSIEEFSSIFSTYDLPPNLRSKLGLRDQLNPARIIKWKYTLQEILNFNLIPSEQVQEKINSWRNHVIEFLNSFPEFELMPYQEDTNKTIISFRLKYKGAYLNEKQLRKLHYITVTKRYKDLSEGKSMVFIGQPVTYFSDKSFLRLAIGSKNIREFVKKNETAFELDKKIVAILSENLTEHYDDL
jgi:hypothetical protein